jgi:hypothetical protein
LDLSSLADNRNCFEEIIIPAFEEFTAKTSTLHPTKHLLEESGSLESGKGDMGDLQHMFDQLFGKFRE